MLKAYYRLTKPGIIYGNLLTAVAGFLLASHWHIKWLLFLATLAGISLVIASACVFNNYIDRDIDAKMVRTKKRALVSGSIPARNAIVYAIILGLVGGLIIIAWVNWLTFAIGTVAFVDYVIAYGWAKRHSEHGTLVGTVAGAAPIVAGYTAVTGILDTEAVILLAIMTFWQMAHFYAIAIYRLEDYQAAKIPVWPARRGIADTKRYIIGYVLAFVIASFALTALRFEGYIYLVAMAVIGAYWLSLALDGLQNNDDKRWARQVFLRSLIVILTFSVALSVGPLLP